MPTSRRRPRSRQPELFARSKRPVIVLDENHRLVQMTDEIDWTEARRRPRWPPSSAARMTGHAVAKPSSMSDDRTRVSGLRTFAHLAQLAPCPASVRARAIAPCPPALHPHRPGSRGACRRGRR